MDDFEAVYRLITTAKYVKEAEDRDAFAAVWTEDATLRITSSGRPMSDGVDGRDAIVAYTTKNWSVGAHGQGDAKEVHVAERPHLIQRAPDRIVAAYNVIFAAVEDGVPVLIGVGEFEDEVVKQNGKWLIQHRRSNIKRRKKPG